MKHNFLFKKIFFVIFLLLSANIIAEDIQFQREIEVTTPRINGNDVKQLQKRLIELDYIEVGEIDGWYGPNSKRSINEFQNDFNLQENGLVDRKLWNLLFSEKVYYLKLLIEETKRINQFSDYRISDYEYEETLENGPGYPIGYLVKSFFKNEALNKIIVRVIGDGSGYNYTAYFNNQNQLIKIEQVWWGYNFETTETENREIKNIFFKDDNFIAVNNEFSLQWILNISEIDKEEINNMKDLIFNAIKHEN